MGGLNDKAGKMTTLPEAGCCKYVQNERTKRRKLLWDVP
jgi:hypothetical protein